MSVGSYVDENRLIRFARWHRSSARKAPAPPVDGVLGHLRELQKDQLAFVLRAREVCGDVSRVRFVILPAHVLAHPDHVRYVLVDNHRAYDKQTKGYNTLRLVLGNGLLTSEGDFWR